VALRSLYVEPEVTPETVDWPALEFNDVFKIYRSGPVETVALRGLDVRIERGEFVAVWGPSGSGKSTFLALAGALDRPTAGEVRSFGDPLSRLAEAELASYRARTLAMVFQSDNLWSALSAEENVRVALTLADRDEATIRARSALDAFGLARRYRHPVHALSGGEQQRVAIARAIVNRPAILLADEPTGNLDTENSNAVLRLLRDLNDRLGQTVLMITHNPEAAAYGHRIVTMRDGRIAQS
jgi:putative ABC transport system ATP-binding protein